MAKSLQVKYETDLSGKLQQSYTLTVTVTNAVDMSAKVFMYQTGAAVPPVSTEELGDQFVGIADPVDLDEVPADAADPLNGMPYYRADTVTLRFRSVPELNETKTAIAGDLAALVTALNTVPVTEEVVTYE